MLCETLDRLLRFHPLTGDQFATGFACVKAVESLFQGQCSLEFTTQTRRLFSGAIQIHSHTSYGSNSISGTGPLTCLINGLGKAGCGSVYLVDKTCGFTVNSTDKPDLLAVHRRVTKSEVTRCAGESWP